jgi:hypothetical protein
MGGAEWAGALSGAGRSAVLTGSRRQRDWVFPKWEQILGERYFWVGYRRNCVDS